MALHLHHPHNFALQACLTCSACGGCACLLKEGGLIAGEVAAHTGAVLGELVVDEGPWG